VAGLAGTAAMTALQLGVRRACGQRLGTPVPRTWADAPPPAQVAKKAADAVGEGRRIIRRPPWRYPVGELALDLSYDVVYGVAVGAAYAALDR
jgi:hypothetical protein